MQIVDYVLQQGVSSNLRIFSRCLNANSKTSVLSELTYSTCDPLRLLSVSVKREYRGRSGRKCGQICHIYRPHPKLEVVAGFWNE